MKSFWHNLPQPFFVLAPMEAVTDVVFRHVVTRAGRPDVYFSEFTNATGWLRAGDKAIGGRLVKTDDESPIVAQLWGSDPEAMAAMSQHVAALGYDGIDINMGCPDQSAIKGGGGADMIRHPGRAAAIIAAAKTSGLPVSVKTRLGYTYVDEWRQWIATLLQQDIVNLTIHLRTKKEMSKVPAHFELIDEILALRDEIAPQTLITINGDIRDRTHGLQLASDHPGLNGIMIGRGVFQDPFCFSKSASGIAEKNLGAKPGPGLFFSDTRTDRELTGLDAPVTVSSTGDTPTPRRAELLELLHYHLDLFDEWQPQLGRPYETLKRFFKIYIRDFDGAKELRDQLMHTKTTDEARQVLANL